MSKQLSNDKLTNSGVFKISDAAQRRSGVMKKPDLEARNEQADAPETTCENGVCMVSWKPKRPAA